MPPCIISIDDFKEQIHGYTPEKAGEFHHESAKMADKEFDRIIKQTDIGKVIFLAGGSASGKTEYLRTILESENAIIFDSTLSTTTGARIKIRKAQKHGKMAEIHYILPDNLRRAFIAFLARDRKFDDNVFYNTHSGSRSTLLWIAKEFPDIPIKIIESSYQKNKLIYNEIKFKESAQQLEFISSIQYSIEDIPKETQRNKNDTKRITPKKS